MGSNPTSPSLGNGTTPQAESSSPRSALTSPEPQTSEKNGEKGQKEPEKSPEEVADLSDMMCSLVTNNCGETRYIGKSTLPDSHTISNYDKGLRLDFLSSRLRVYSG